MTGRIWSAALVLGTVLAATSAQASTAEEFETAYASATAHEKQAATNKNQWPTTEDALKAARKAADAKDFDRAVALAKQADELAQASLYQSKTESTAWKDAPIP